MGNCCGAPQESKAITMHKEKLEKERMERAMGGGYRESSSRRQSMMSHRKMVEMNKEMEEDERRSLYTRKGSCMSMRSRRDSVASMGTTAGNRKRSCSFDDGASQAGNTFGGNGGYTPHVTVKPAAANAMPVIAYNPNNEDIIFDRSDPNPKDSTRVSFNELGNSSPTLSLNSPDGNNDTSRGNNDTVKTLEPLLRSPVSLKSSLKTSPAKKFGDDCGTELNTSKNTIIKLNASGEIDAELLSTDCGSAASDSDEMESASQASPMLRPQNGQRGSTNNVAPANGGLSKRKLLRNSLRYSNPPKYPGEGIRIHSRVASQSPPPLVESRRVSSRHSLQSNASEISAVSRASSARGGLNGFRKRRNSQLSQYSDDASVEEKQWL
eukprot:TRINITY_DN1055_c1_g1_i1.p1 TRINITY_DN1055_c1_g1~~TRINITY_DN1055_c1_g1_i1.p1  ORF type:complete len:381 (+),score=71.22 TRINITY_DN1055_c1_g1_i1:25-1167(+)